MSSMLQYVSAVLFNARSWLATCWQAKYTLSQQATNALAGRPKPSVAQYIPLISSMLSMQTVSVTDSLTQALLPCHRCKIQGLPSLQGFVTELLLDLIDMSCRLLAKRTLQACALLG